jgi:hypothetical protein
LRARPPWLQVSSDASSGGYASDASSCGYASDASSGGYASDASSGYASSDGEHGSRAGSSARVVCRGHPLHHAAVRVYACDGVVYI